MEQRVPAKWDGVLKTTTTTKAGEAIPTTIHVQIITTATTTVAIHGAAITTAGAIPAHPSTLLAAGPVVDLVVVAVVDSPAAAVTAVAVAAVVVTPADGTNPHWFDLHSL